MAFASDCQEEQQLTACIASFHPHTEDQRKVASYKLQSQEQAWSASMKYHQVIPKIYFLQGQ